MARHLPAAILLLLGAALWQPGGRAQAPAGDPAGALARRAADRIRALQREADGLAARERTLLVDLRRLEVERELRAEQVSQGLRDLEVLQAELGANAARIDSLQQQASVQLPDLSARLVELYKLGHAGYARLLLNVDDLRDVGRAYRFVSALRAIDGQRIAEYRRVAADLRRERAGLEARRERQVALQQDTAAARDAAARAAAALARLVDDIDARRDLNARLVGELQVAHQRLQRAVADVAAGGAADAAKVTLPLRPFQGDLDWPAAGPLVSRFGRQRHPRFRTSVASNGIVIGAERGAAVRAIHEGAVAFAEPFSGFGQLLIIDHGNLAFTMYGHLGDLLTPVGTRVGRGQIIGSVGSTLDGSPALYFELRIDGKPVDPLQWLKKR